MNLLQPDLLAELYIAIDQNMRANLSVTKLHKASELSLEDTVGQIIQTAIRMVTDWGHTGYGVRFTGWIGSSQPMRPEVRALLEAAGKLAKYGVTPLRLKRLRLAHAAYAATQSAQPRG